MKFFPAIASVFALTLFLASEAHAMSPMACPEYWAPVCAAQEVQCVRAPCYPQYKTYSNSCFVNADGATTVHEGECTASESGPYKGGGTSGDSGTYVPPTGCLAWFDGCNSCSRASANGPAMCTLMACTSDNHQPGYCRSYEVPKPPVDGDTPVSSPPATTTASSSDSPRILGDDIVPPPQPESALQFVSRLWTSAANWYFDALYNLFFD